ncbi:MAG: flippase-like domain-containing protein [Bacteroidales bacterium]|jgi:hypothetical protein|nr:flippase-like domain-containing protein [Bacteroidales bacterium]
MKSDDQGDIVRQLSPKRIIVPLILGLAVVIWLIAKDLNTDVFNAISFSWRSVFWLTVAISLVVMRTFFYMLRIRILTNNDLTWRQSFNVIILWEFASAVTPSTVGGTALAVIFLHKEGLNTGRSTAVTLVTSFLDELYFVIMLPLLVLLIGGRDLFITSLHGTGPALLNNLVLVAVIGYIVILAWVLLIGYGLFVNPRVISRIITGIFRLPGLRRWKSHAEKAAIDLIESSAELKHESWKFWSRAILTTFLTWTSRYWVVNAILLAFFSSIDLFLVFARELVLWVIMLVSPTPGGSGFSEIILGRYISDLLPSDPAVAGGLAIAMALLWRLISYYPFLIAGIIVAPGWIQRKFVRKVTRKN